MKYREPSSDLSGIGPHISTWTNSRAIVPSRSGERVEFGSVSRNNNAHISSSLSRASGCSQSPLTGLVRLETCELVGHATGLSSAIWPCSRPLLD